MYLFNKRKKYIELVNWYVFLFNLYDMCSPVAQWVKRSLHKPGSKCIPQGLLKAVQSPYPLFCMNMDGSIPAGAIFSIFHFSN